MQNTAIPAATATAASAPDQGETPTSPPENTPPPTQAPASTEEPAPTEAPQATPTPETLLPTPTTAVVDCLNQAIFVDDVTIPDGTFIEQGSDFVKTWRIKNDGTCSWNDRYSLVYAGGEVMNGPLSSPLPLAAPGDTIDISIDLQAPTRGGSYTGNWWFSSDTGQNFGVGVPATGRVWVAINVGFIPQGGQSGQGGQGGQSGQGGQGSSSPSTPAPAAQPTQPAAGCSLQRDPAYEQQVLALINQGRGSQGLPLLVVEPRLQAAALRHSNDMACNNWASHVGTDGSDWYARVSQAGYPNYNSARENVWTGIPKFGANPEWFYTQMYNSPIHHDNMFFPTATEIGIAFVINTTSEEGYITLVFARP